MIVTQDTSVDNRFRDFIGHLHRAGSWGYLWAKLPNGAKRSLWHPAGRPAVIPGAWAGGDLYFGVHACTQIPPTNANGEPREAAYVRSQIAYIAAANCLFAEYDDKDHDTHEGALRAALAASTTPSVIVDSGGGFHAYWLLTEPYTITTPESLDSIVTIQYAWQRHVGGSTGVNDLARVLRVPGTLNHKYNRPRRVSFVHFDMGRLYSIADLFAAVAHSLCQRTVAAAAPAFDGRRVSSTGSGDVAELRRAAMERSSQMPEFRRLWSGDTSKERGDHSLADAHLCDFIGFWWGRDAAIIDQVFRQSGLYRPERWDVGDYAERTIRFTLRKTSEWRPSQRDQAAIRAAQELVR